MNGGSDSGLSEEIMETTKDEPSGITPRDSDDSNPFPDVLHDLEEELERELEVKAERNHLTAWNVKNMIKAVITDSEVMKMVDFSLQKSIEKPVYELKLTRAKTKELKGLEHNALWNMQSASTSKKSDIEVLITQDLSEDSSDEEYNPLDELSDEESRASESILEDSESVMEDGDSTLEVDGARVGMKASTRTNSSEKNNKDAENIGQRTRSKLSLSETPLEAIEQAFIPPDITTDMYDTECDNVDWLNFLKEFMQPLDSNQPEVVDDDNDPEYNVMIDEEHEDADKEELRQDRAVKVTKKELNDLMAELAEYTEMLSSDDEEGDSKEDEIDVPKEESVTVSKNSNNIELFSKSQSLLLTQQLQQHVQLLLQSYLLLYCNPAVNVTEAVECRKRLDELDNFRKMRDTSFFDVLNLNSSIKLINDWTDFASKPENTGKIQRFMKTELEKVTTYKATKVRYHPKLPQDLMKLCLNSDAFLYPLFLPPGGFIDFTLTLPSRFTPSEDQLIAMGLEQFSILLESDLNRQDDFMELIGYIRHYLIPVKTEAQISSHINRLLKKRDHNPVKEFFMSKKAPEVEHYVVTHTKLKLLFETPIVYFPDNWTHYIESCYTQATEKIPS